MKTHHLQSVFFDIRAPSFPCSVADQVKNHPTLNGKVIRVMWANRDANGRKSGVGNVFVKFVYDESANSATEKLSGSIVNGKQIEKGGEFIQRGVEVEMGLGEEKHQRRRVHKCSNDNGDEHSRRWVNDGKRKVTGRSWGWG
ncbi:hypothetical protein LguiA_020601 [Lonicera macranthoides]